MKKNKEFHIAFGIRLRTAREKAGITRERFAELINKSPTFVADVERGSVGVSVPTLMRICETLSISSDRLLWDTTTEISINERLQLLDSSYIEVIDKAILNQIELIRLAENRHKTQTLPQEETPED